MAEQKSIQQQLAEEQESINSLTDTTEAALRGAALKWKVASLKGEDGASGQLLKSQKSLDEYLAARDVDGWFRSAKDAGAWLSGQGYITNRGNILSADVARKLVEGLKKDPSKGYSRRLVIQTADMKWGKPGGRADESRPPLQEEIDKAAQQARIAKETADKIAMQNEVSRGALIPREEAEARWIQAAAFLKQDLINFGPKAADLMLEALSLYLRGNGVDLDGLNLSSVSADLLEIYDRSLENWLDRYARTAQTPEVSSVC